MNSRNAAGEPVGGVEHRRVGVGERGTVREQSGTVLAGRSRVLDRREQRDGPARPHRPLAKQPAVDPSQHGRAADADRKRREQIGDDVVVVARV